MPRIWPQPHAPQRFRPLGQFRDLEPSPQDPTAAIVGEFQMQMTDSPGLRNASTTGRRVFFGGAIPIQRFVRPAPADPNSPENIAALGKGMQSDVARRAYGRNRGTGLGVM